MKIVNKAVLLIIAAVLITGCSKPDTSTALRAKYTTVIDATVLSKSCTLLIPGAASVQPSTGETLVNAYAGQQIGSLAGEAVAGKNGAVLGGVAGALSTTMPANVKRPETYCKLQLELLDGSTTELLLEDYYIKTLNRKVSVVQGQSTFGNWNVIDQLPNDKAVTVTDNVLNTVDGKPVVQLTRKERDQLASDLLSGDLGQRMTANRQLTTEMECVYTAGITEQLARRAIEKQTVYVNKESFSPPSN